MLHILYCAVWRKQIGFSLQIKYRVCYQTLLNFMLPTCPRVLLGLLCSWPCQLPPFTLLRTAFSIRKTDKSQICNKQLLLLVCSREAARECRRKKKEYVKCLENRVAVLENQNKTLIEELKTLKDLYCHKSV